MKTSLVFVLCWLQIALASGNAQIKWWNPATSDFPVIEGQAWPNSVKDKYDRLPAVLEKEVRPAVWNLSKQTAGLMVRFRTNANKIVVRYQTTNTRYEMPHMPATGVSGVDLYSISSDGVEKWCMGGYAFKDTVQYTYGGLASNDNYHKLGREYRLYLPLYNGVKWLEIGVESEFAFEALPVRAEEPIVVYGTSIAQGACASRPGLAWTSILSRKMDRQLINLGFSGNGQLEEPLIHEIAKINAKVYILDCLPNLPVADKFPNEEIRKRLKYAVKYLREKRPSTPIVLADHAGYTDGATNEHRKKMYERVNKVQNETFQELRSEGLTNIYKIDIVAFDLHSETTVDGTHPNDLGMYNYAVGYEKALRQILNEPIGEFKTTQPVTQLRELGGYDWELRHHSILKWNTKNPPKTVLIGNSITHYWAGDSLTKRAADPASWNGTFGDKNVRNMGYGWDRIENVLWRVYHGELDGFQADRIIVNIGTNNLGHNSDEEIIAGWKQLIPAIKARQPQAKLIITGIYPRRGMEERVAKLNRELAALLPTVDFTFWNPGIIFLGIDSKIVEGYFSDGLHPNAEGYRLLGKSYKDLLAK